MANPEHVAKLKEGVEVWNAWRKAHPQERPDLREANLRGADLEGADLEGADLEGADLSGADLSGADLSGASLSSDQLCTARTLARVILDSSLAVDVCNDCPDKFGPASDYKDGDPRRCGEGVSVE